MKHILVVLMFLILGANLNQAKDKHPLTVEDLWNMERLDGFALSPKGDLAAISTTKYNLEKNSGKSSVYIIDLKTAEKRRLRASEESQTEPVFSKDGDFVYLIEKDQLCKIRTDGTGFEQISSVPTGVSGLCFSKDFSKLLFNSYVYPDLATTAETKAKDESLEKSKVKARIIDDLMYKHWNRFRGDKRSHLFLMDMYSLKSIDLNLGLNNEVPPLDLGSSHDYSFSPDGNEVAFTMNPEPVVARSTNNEVYVLKLTGALTYGFNDYKKISVSLGNDNEPVYSPNGKYIAFRSMRRAGFEADKSRLMLYDRENGSTKDLTEKIDLSVSDIAFSEDSKYIYFNADNSVYRSIYRLALKSGKLDCIYEKGVNDDIALSNGRIFFRAQRSDMPYDLFSVSAKGGDSKRHSDLNRDLLSSIEMNPMETFYSEGAEGAKVQSIMIKPPFFDQSKKYPLALIIHGGPQGNWNDEFHYRWNLQMFAAKGYVVVAPNPRGSTGYGQDFVDGVSKDWGGKPYIDIMNSYNNALDSYGFIDKNNKFALGASYGGFMVDWLEGHTDCFNAMVSHAGVFDLESMYGVTEELWFPEWEFNGTPYDNKELYEKWSPKNYVKNFKTPLLVVCGALDYRVPEGQSFELFTALKTMKVDSKLLYFPDEFHFVIKPQNAKLWWETVYSWLESHKK